MSDASYAGTKETLEALIPERCKPCHIPQFTIARLCVQVSTGEKNEDEVYREANEAMRELEQTCRYGYIENTTGCFGGGDCSNGVLCRFPSYDQGGLLD